MDKLDAIIGELKRQSGGEPKDSDLFRAFQYFVSLDGIYGKTKITPSQRNMLYVYSLMDKKHPKWKLKDAGETLAHLLISEDGESRKGMIEFFKGLLHTKQQQQPEMPPMNGPGSNIKGRDF